MKLPMGVDFCSQMSLYKNKGHGIPENKVLLTDIQRVIAYGLKKAWYADNLLKPPFKPIGMEVDPSLEHWGCDIRKHQVIKAVLKDCPMPPDCEELKDERHDPNWFLPSTGLASRMCLKYMFTGLNYKRFATTKSSEVDGCYSNDKREYRVFRGEAHNMLRLDNAHLYQEIRCFKQRANRVQLVVN
jgi:hypothetical protein